MTPTRQLEFRAREAVSRCLIRALAVPNIYFEANWPDGRVRRVDVLAIDRTGVGDVHIVEIKYDAKAAMDSIPSVMKIPAQFRWIAFYRETVGPESLAKAMDRNVFYPSNGMGRVGVIEVVRTGEHDLSADIAIRAERFLGSFKEKVRKFTRGHPADVEFV